MNQPERFETEQSTDFIFNENTGVGSVKVPGKPVIELCNIKIVREDELNETATIEAKDLDGNDVRIELYLPNYPMSVHVKELTITAPEELENT